MFFVIEGVIFFLTLWHCWDLEECFLVYGSLGVFSLPGVLILHIKLDLRLMSHKWLVLRRICHFNAAELSYDRNKQDDYIARDYFLLIYCYVRHYLLNRPLCISSAFIIWTKGT